MPEDPGVNRALARGAQRSRDACSVPDRVPLPVRIWNRHKWKIIGIAIFLFLDFLLLGGLGSKMATHF